MGKRQFVENFVSLNTLDTTGVTFGDISRPIRFSDPKKVRELLGVSEISENLFPLLSAGVRYWPWLLVARKFLRKREDRKKRRRMEFELARIHRRVNNSKLSFANRGPQSYGTMRFYLGMIKKVLAEETVSPLKDFLGNKKHKFDGSQYYYFEDKYKTLWQGIRCRVSLQK